MRTRHTSRVRRIACTRPTGGPVRLVRGRFGSLAAGGALVATTWLACLGLTARLATAQPTPVAVPNETAPLRVCLLAHNLPFSERDTETGFDVDVGRAVAENLRRPFVPVWIAHDERITEVDESDFPLHRLANGDCDAIFSVPGRDAIREESSLAVGRAYYGAAFTLVGRAGRTPASVRDVEMQSVAVQAQTIAGFILEALRIPMRTFFSTDEALAALTDGSVELAFVWGPTAGWYATANPHARLDFATAEPLSVARWNEYVATRQPDVALRSEIDAALARLRNNGTLKNLAGRYGIPWHPPFDTTYDVIDMLKLSRDAAKK